ncbi:mucoidy inhibitor MuiA family protein [[Limnothrix rosea] IAM M-220]|uniref:mucoidy inhibitor MuiA family protein n=1 Tax=[Limnothrix rosea] IAM M-220 TaxID=454133 RepID=UPI000962CAB3|nr:mucoidy inhibitor MuiA family protein [[Limnothrix rosea] IAM M-220]OKH18109.1 hypothetical protein NIES208_07135 [[Limnothrix rosea] IAM M-220]
MARNIDTAIAAVTVLSDRAVVTRRGKFSVSPTDQYWSISPLPLTMSPDSIRVKGRGTASVKFVAIATETIVTVESLDDKIAPLNQRIEALQGEAKSEGDRLKTLALQQNFVGNLSEEAVGRFAKNLATAKVSLDQANSFLDFIGTQHQTFSQKIQNHQERIRQLTREIQALEQQKALLRNPAKKRHYDLALTVEVVGSGEFELDINYQVSQAKWLPRYDLAIDTARKTLTLDYLADVIQSTGEAWHNADLTISTAQVAQGIIPPELSPWYLNIRQVPPPRPMATTMPRAKKRRSPPPGREMADEAMVAAAMPEEEIIESAPSTSEVKQQGSTVTFHVGAGGNIPSDHNPHQVTLFHGEYPIELTYLALPQKVSFAYLQGNVTNPMDGVTLLPGVANLFRDQAFVGKDQLQNISPGQDMTLNLGIDEGLQIERKLGDRQVDKTLISQLRRITYAYEITVKNLRDQPKSLTLQEQIPIGRHEKIKVNLQKIEPKIDPTKLGILTWKTELNPQEKFTFTYQYTVEYPPNLPIQGLLE